jgi:hypothetical protein
MYRTKEYRERPWEEIKTEIDHASDTCPETERVFLADGDALNLPADLLINVLIWNVLHVMPCPKT